MKFVPVTRFLRFFSVTVGVDDQQREEEYQTDQHHNDDGLMRPDFGHEIAQIIKHPTVLYTGSGHCETLFLSDRVSSGHIGIRK